MRGVFTLFAALASAVMLASCGLQPLYSEGRSGAVGQTLGAVQVEPIEGQAGWLVRNAVADRLQPFSPGTAPRYRLDIQLDDQLEGLGLRTNDTVSREVRKLRARYQLIDTATGEVVLDATAGSDAGIDVASSEYATISAENTALENLALRVADQIVTRLSLYARGQTGAQTPDEQATGAQSDAETDPGTNLGTGAP